MQTHARRIFGMKKFHEFLQKLYKLEVFSNRIFQENCMIKKEEKYFARIG